MNLIKGTTSAGVLFVLLLIVWIGLSEVDGEIATSGKSHYLNGIRDAKDKHLQVQGYDARLHYNNDDVELWEGRGRKRRKKRRKKKKFKKHSKMITHMLIGAALVKGLALPLLFKAMAIMSTKALMLSSLSVLVVFLLGLKHFIESAINKSAIRRQQDNRKQWSEYYDPYTYDPYVNGLYDMGQIQM